MFESLTRNGVNYTTDASKAYNGNGKGVIQTLNFPENLSSGESPHYMVFYINELATGKYKNAVKARVTSADSPVFLEKNSTTSNAMVNRTLRMSDEQIKTSVNNIKASTAKAAGGEGITSNAIGSLTDSILTGSKKLVDMISPEYQRTTVCIALPMPEALNVGSETTWGDTSNELLGNILSMIDAANSKAPKEFVSRAIDKGVSKLVTNAFGDIGNQITKSIANPRREMLFQGVLPRRFNFQWTLWPRSPEESKAIWDICQMFKYHMLPEYDEETFGLFLTFPNTFDIEFHSNGKRNNWLPKSSTCACVSFDINYMPGGTAAFFEDPQNQFVDGAPPVGVSISASFVELETMFRNRLDPNGDYSFNQGQGATQGTF